MDSLAYGYLLTDGQGVIADIMPIRWAFEALSVLEYSALQKQNEHVRDLVDVIGFPIGVWDRLVGHRLFYNTVFCTHAGAPSIGRVLRVDGSSLIIDILQSGSEIVIASFAQMFREMRGNVSGRSV